MSKQSIKRLSRQQLQEALQELGQPKFRAQQVYEWVYGKHAASFDEMTNLPKALRETLAESYELSFPEVAHKALSSDGTEKYVVRFADGACVETVGIPSANGQRLTVCFSTQAGCSMACSFCATGKQGLTRNLTCGEMVDQVALVGRQMGRRVTNVVAMGQGEPFANFDAVRAALEIMNDPKALGIAARQITVSTCGILSGIRRFSEIPEQFTLAVSLHSADQATRDKLMPSMAHQTLPALRQAIVSYTAKTNRRVTLEYILLAGENDSDAHLEALTEFARGLLCHVNLIPLNAVDGSSFKPSDHATVGKWVRALEKAGVQATVRRSKGGDIAGACGQLKNEMTAPYRP